MLSSLHLHVNKTRTKISGSLSFPNDGKKTENILNKESDSKAEKTFKREESENEALCVTSKTWMNFSTDLTQLRTNRNHESECF